MVLRPDVVSLPAGMALRELFAAVATGEHTRYPVHEDGRPDRIVGAVHAKDVMRAVEDGGGLRVQVRAEDVMREVLKVPENRRVDDVLQDLKGHRLHMAIVIDEWGSVEGIVTVEDVVEEIVGEIREEFDEKDPSARENPDGSHSMGGTPIEETNRALLSGFASEDFETVGGLVFGRLGRPQGRRRGPPRRLPAERGRGRRFLVARKEPA